MSILAQFSFKGRQEQAATAESSAIAVTAGAGSGKTRVLTGRYLHLLERGHPLRSLIAITFTEKAAREMRTRIRSELERWATSPPPNLEDDWRSGARAALADIDSARIGTIHSLCAEILRAHPAEAGIDPGFTVLEEGLAAALRAEAVEAALGWAAGAAQLADAAQLFAHFKENDLRGLLAGLLNRRLDVERWLINLEGAGNHEDFKSELLRLWSSALASWLEDQFRQPSWRDSLADLAGLQALSPDDKLELARREVLARWEEARAAIAARQWDSTCIALTALRKAIDTRGGSKANWDSAGLETARGAMRALSRHYEEHIKPLAAKSRWALDEQAADLLPALRQLIQWVLDEYEQRKDERQALDFDDLEGRAARLLSEFPTVRERWQREIHAVLVDEFQDTNQRQQQIVYALSEFNPPPHPQPLSLRERGVTPLPPGEGLGVRGNLFVVGDAKQSIYKFRGADVTVFRQVQADIAAAGGLTIDLDLTFRAHKPLLDLLNPLLAPILGESSDSTAPKLYQVPFAPLQADRLAPKTARPPYVEFLVGLGEDGKRPDDGRTAAANALANRLHELRAEGFEWGDFALLFRASAAFAIYEDALERAAIPFVTIAGRGFYNRPEIRDLLNALAAIADPRDDLALAGLLRSPALALPDADLYRLRFPSPSPPTPLPPGEGSPPSPGGRGVGDEGEGLWPTLCASPNPLHRRAASIIGELHSLSGRAPAAEVLKRFLDLTGALTILRAAPGGERMTRNVEKLLSDAHRSRLVELGEFLEYIQTLRDVGLREGEAPVEAGGAVQLMTVHKSKGLEFPVVVIADAAYEPRTHTGGALLDPALGLLPGLKDDEDSRPLAWRLASLNEAAKDDAEDRRLLYVAATRAQEKLLVSGHSKVLKSGKLSLRGWLGDLGKVLGMDEMIAVPGLEAAPVKAGGRMGRQEVSLTLPPGGDPIPWVVVPAAAPVDFSAPHGDQTPEIQPVSGDLLAPLAEGVLSQLYPEEGERTYAYENAPLGHTWRVVPKARKPSGPAWVVGKLVHEALRRWRFPGAKFDELIRPYALEAGLADEGEIRAAIQEARRLLERFRAHPLFAEIEASERYHDVPYVLPDRQGTIDLLYRQAGQWAVVDFKTDEASSEDEVVEIVRREGYDQHLRRSVEAAAAWLACRPQARLVFLRVAGEVKVIEAD